MSETTTIESTSAALDLPPANTTTTGLVLHADNMESMMRAAELMAAGRATVPKHLQNNPSDCMAVIMQAMQWNMNPFVVAQKTHLVNGTLGYEAQLVNAVVQSSGAITGRFHYEYQGEGRDLECRVGATIAGESAITWGEWLKLSAVTTQNSPLWKTNPRQQIGYLQVKNWTRAYTPGALLGVYTSDELIDSQPRERDITPRTAAEFAQAAKPQPAATVDREQIIRDLEMIARSDDPAPQRITELEAAWLNLSKDERAAVGASEIQRLKALSAAEDATPTPASEVKPEDDSPFEGIQE
jgi:hypothetical protein